MVPVVLSMAVIFAPGRADPEESVTLPEMVAEVSCPSETEQIRVRVEQTNRKTAKRKLIVPPIGAYSNRVICNTNAQPFLGKRGPRHQCKADWIRPIFSFSGEC